MKITKVNDYLDRVCQKFPNIPKSDIRKILNYGLKRLYYLNSYGCDISLQNEDSRTYFGSMYKDSIAYYKYYIRKLTVKLRVMYKVLNKKYSGYYYFALTKPQYEAYLAQKHTGRGRPKKNFIFEKIMLFKIYDECNIMQNGHVAIFRFPYSWDRGFSFYQAKLKTDKAELILLREPLKFKDILLSEYNYEFIIDEQRKYKKK